MIFVRVSIGPSPLLKLQQDQFFVPKKKASLRKKITQGVINAHLSFNNPLKIKHVAYFLGNGGTLRVYCTLKNPMICKVSQLSECQAAVSMLAIRMKRMLQKDAPWPVEVTPSASPRYGRGAAVCQKAGGWGVNWNQFKFCECYFQSEVWMFLGSDIFVKHVHAE